MLSVLLPSPLLTAEPRHFRRNFDGPEEIAPVLIAVAELRRVAGGMDAAQHKDSVLTLLFMKYVSDKAAAVDPRQAARGTQPGTEQPLAGGVPILSVGRRVLRWC